jgi:hypothetical protein
LICALRLIRPIVFGAFHGELLANCEKLSRFITPLHVSPIAAWIGCAAERLYYVHNGKPPAVSCFVPDSADALILVI